MPAPSAEVSAEVVRNESAVNPDSYEYAYETSNGISAQATGQLKEVSKDESAIVSRGQYGYKSPEGEDILITYIADENGFQPQGASLPTPPPIPVAIGNYRAHSPNNNCYPYIEMISQYTDIGFILFCSSCFGIPCRSPTT